MQTRNKKTFIHIAIVAVIFMLGAFLFNTCQAQTSTTEILKVDSTFFEVVTTTYPDGREVTIKTPYDFSAFADKIIDANIVRSIQIRERESQNTEAQRDINQSRRYVNDSLGVNADSILNLKLLTALSGNWKFVERDGLSNTVTDVSINEHAGSPVLLRMAGGGNVWSIKAIDTHYWELRHYKKETVAMELKQFHNFTGYRGVARDGTVLILRR